MGIPVGELQHRISSQEFTEYLAYFTIEPYPEERADINAAMIACLLANAYRDPKTKPRPFELRDFRIDYWKQTRAPVDQTVDHMKAQMTFLGKVMTETQRQGTSND